MSESKNLHQRLVEVMRTMGAVGKGGQTNYGEKFAYHKIDDIDEALRGALVQHGVVATVREINDRKLDHFEETDRQGKPRTTWYAECLIVIELVNADDPKDISTIVGWGQGLDYSDKATGKAISYAAKSAYLSAFHLRGQPDNEEDNIVKPGKSAAEAKTAPDLSAAAKSWVDAINQADCIDSLNAVGEGLRNETPEMQNAARPFYAKKMKELKAKK